MAAVTIYTTNCCVFCLRAKDYLRSRGVDFEEIDVSDDDAAREGELLAIHEERALDRGALGEDAHQLGAEASAGHIDGEARGLTETDLEAAALASQSIFSTCSPKERRMRRWQLQSSTTTITQFQL